MSAKTGMRTPLEVEQEADGKGRSPLEVEQEADGEGRSPLEVGDETRGQERQLASKDLAACRGRQLRKHPASRVQDWRLQLECRSDFSGN